MDISKYIYDFLSENDSVTVPGLGRFMVKDKPSEIKGDLISPPGKAVEYDSTNDEDDGVLTSYISQKENIDIDRAKSETTEFYNHLKTKLARRHTIMLGKLGTLSVNDAGDIIFDPDADLFIESKADYGLGQISLSGTRGSMADTVKNEPAIKPVTTELNVSEPMITPTTELVGEKDSSSEQESKSTPENMEESLFAGGNVRVRENTERRRASGQEPQESSVKPTRSDKKTPPPSKKTPEKKKQTSGSNSMFPGWLVAVLILTVILGVGSYFLYPKLSTFFNPVTTGSSVKDDKTIETTQPIVEPETPVNPEVAKTLDKAIEKKNALSPGGETSSQTTTQSSAPTKTQPSQAASVSIPGNFERKKYLLIVGSFTTKIRADKYGNMLKNAGIDYEIIDFGNERIRVAVAGYDNKTEAFNAANRFKSKPLCENVWVLGR